VGLEQRGAAGFIPVGGSERMEAAAAAAAQRSPILAGDSAAAAAAAPSSFKFAPQQPQQQHGLQTPWDEGSAGEGLSAGFVDPEVSLPRWGVRVRRSRQHQVKLEGSEVMLMPAGHGAAAAAVGSLPLSGRGHSPQPSTAAYGGGIVRGGGGDSAAAAAAGGGGAGGWPGASMGAQIPAQQQQLQGLTAAAGAAAAAAAGGGVGGVVLPVGDDDGDLSDSCSQVRAWH
jgi:hypothetical protein